MSEHLRILIAEDIDLVAEAFQALLDVDMPGATGIEATAQLAATCPDIKVLLLTSLPGSGHIPKALAAGASGYVVKSMSATQLVDAIRSVASGHTVIDPQLAADALRSGPNPLSRREVQLLQLVEQGLDTQSIAYTMFVTKGTVRNYLSIIMAKMDATTRAQAATAARGNGWL